MTNLEFFQIVNKYHLITFIVIVFIFGWLYESIEIKWEARGNGKIKNKGI